MMLRYDTHTNITYMQKEIKKHLCRSRTENAKKRQLDEANDHFLFSFLQLCVY